MLQDEWNEAARGVERRQIILFTFLAYRGFSCNLYKPIILPGDDLKEADNAKTPMSEILFDAK